MAKIAKKKVSAQPKPPCVECMQGEKIPDTIQFYQPSTYSAIRIRCGYCSALLPISTTDKLSGIKIRSAVMAGVANAK